ncbi:MAG: hypothetical protein Q8L14_38670 [Myxococcales bacterium]|nr:hypothetical protein [Myxococcales bacterium]
MPSFFRRLLLFASPRLWAEARNWSTGSILLPILVVQLLLEAGLGLYRGLDFHASALTLAQTYDQQFDPIILEKNQVRVDGPRLPRWDDDDRTILVDPEEREPLSMLKGRRSIVVRRSAIYDSDRGEPTPIAQVTELFGIDSLRIDSASLTTFFAERKAQLVVGMLLFIGVFGVVGLAITAPLGAFLASLLLMAFRGKEAGLTRDQCFTVALATLSIRPVLELGLNLAGTGVGFCLGLAVWPALATGLSLFALRGRAQQPADPSQG